MSILTTELKKYAAASRPLNDTSTAGGAIDTDCVLGVTQLAATDAVRARSSNAGDTMNLTIKYRDAAGVIQTQTQALNGVTNVVFNSMERFISATLASNPAGAITIERNTSGNANVVTIPAGKKNASILFVDSASEASSTTRYEKEFWKNESGESLTLTNAQVTLTQDPASSIRIGLDTSVNGTATVSNRKTAPSSVTFVDDSVAINVPGGGNLAATAGIGVWIEMTRGAGAAALKSYYETQLAGTST